MRPHTVETKPFGIFLPVSSAPLILTVVSASSFLPSSRVPAADQMVPGPAALRPAHPGADLRPPLDEDDDDDGVAQVTGGAGRRRHPPQDHRHRLFVKHKLEQGEPLRNGSDGLKRLSGERRGLDGGSDIWTQGQQPVALHSAGLARKMYVNRLSRFNVKCFK